MRKTTLLCMTMLIMYEMVTAQKTEYYVTLNSGFYHYSGENSSGQTGIILSPGITPLIYNSPGRKNGFSYEFSLQGLRVARKKIIYGLHIDYQSFQSKTDIIAVLPTIYSSSIFMAEGSSRLTSTFISITPFAGYRLSDKKVVVDLKAGPEFGLCAGRNEKINATITNTSQEIHENHSVSNKRADLRISLLLAATYRRIGINAGYFWGLSNYYERDAIGRPESYSRFFRLGINYRIR